MGRTVTLCYSSSAAGNTARLLEAFLRGAERGGDDVESFAVKDLAISPCTGELHCWEEVPGECYIQDDMRKIYAALRHAKTLVLATPVYIPLPGEMQNCLNRLCPILDPQLVTRRGRTRARMRASVPIERIVLVATSGWWELGNFDTVLRIAAELAEDASIPLVGAVLRPHAHLALSAKGKPEEILSAAERAGFELATTGTISEEALSLVSQPVVRQEDYR